VHVCSYYTDGKAAASILLSEVGQAIAFRGLSCFPEPSGAANPGCRRLSAGAPALFHEIPRAAGPLQQTAKTDRLFECPTLKADSSKQYCSEGGTVLRIAGGAVTPVRIRPIPFRAAGVF